MLREYAESVRKSEIYTGGHQYKPASDREYWDRFNKKTTDPVVKKAEEYLNYQWPSLLATDFLQFERTGNRVAWETPNFERRRILSYLILAECIEYKGRFLDDIINGVVLTCEETYWGLSAHRYGGSTGIQENYDPYLDIFASNAAYQVAMASYLLGDVLDKSITDRIFAEVKFRMTDAFLKHNDYWWQGIPTKPGEKRFVNNWNIWICSNIIKVLAALPFETDYRNQVLAKVLEVLDIYLDTIPEDGGSTEGPGYYCGDFVDMALPALYDLTDGAINVFDNERLQKFAAYGACIGISKGFALNYSDSVGRSRGGGDPTRLFSLGKWFNVPILCKMAKDCYYNDLDAKLTLGGNLWCLDGLNIENEIANYDDSAVSPEAFVSSYYFDKIELVTEWQNRKEEKGIFFSAKGGNNGDSHAHNDVGTFLVYANGTPFMIDPSKGTYTKDHFNENRYKIWTNVSSWHNIPDINGETQYHGYTFAAENTTFTPSQTQSRFNLDLEKAYGKNSMLENFNRDFAFDKVGGTVTVTDSFKFTQKENTVVENFIFPSKPEIDGNAIYVTTENGTKCKLMFSGDGKAEIDFHDTSYDEHTLAFEWPNGVWRVKITFACGETEKLIFKASTV